MIRLFSDIINHLMPSLMSVQKTIGKSVTDSGYVYVT